MQCYYVTAVCEVFDLVLVYCSSRSGRKQRLTELCEGLHSNNEHNNQRKKYKIVTSTHHRPLRI